MAYSDSFPAIRPSFQFNADAGRLDPRITFSRSDTPPTYAAPSAVHYWSNEKHLSSENLLLDSKTGTANWTAGYVGGGVTPTVTANHAASPDGTANQATRLQLSLNGNTGTGDYSRYYQNYNVPSGTSATFTVWMKSTDGSSSYTAQIVSPAGSGTAVTVTGTWQQFTVTANSAGNVTYGVRLVGGQTPTNSDTADILIWGANLSTTGQTVLSETTTQIHRSYAPTLKSVSTAGQPRFEYSPTDSASEVMGQSRGLLIEGSSTNIIERSSEFGNVYWGKINSSVIDNAAIAPDGTLTADLIVEASETSPATNSHYAYRPSITPAASTSYTYSLYLKAAGRNNALLFTSIGGVSGYCNFNLSNGTVAETSGAVVGAISSVSNGWYRCSINWTTTSTASGIVSIYTANSDSTFDYTGNGYSGILCWGAQVEAGHLSSLISTSGSAVTRAADSAAMVSSNFGLSGGPVSVVGEFRFLEDEASPVGTWTAAPRLVTIAGSDDDVEIYRNTTDGANTLVANVEVNGTDYQALATTTNTSAGADYKVGLSLQSGSIKGCMNGGVVGENTNAVFPDISSSTMYVGSINATQGHMNGYCKRIAVFSEALSDTNLQALTS